MQEKWSRTQTATLIGPFVLSIVLAGGTAVAQPQERRGSQMQQLSQQEMSQRHNRDIENRVEMRLARSSALTGSKIKVGVEDRIVSFRDIVGSERDKERALRLARRVRGAKKVEDELSVDKAAVDKSRNVEVRAKSITPVISPKRSRLREPCLECARSSQSLPRLASTIPPTIAVRMMDKCTLKQRGP